LSEQLLTHVREKLCRKSLEKFARNISEWLARDPFKLAAAEKRPSSVAEMRPLDETVACTPGKKKRFLFSQSTMNNSLLDPDGVESTRHLPWMEANLLQSLTQPQLKILDNHTSRIKDTQLPLTATLPKINPRPSII